MLFIEYPKCSTCKKAKKYLEDHNIHFIDRNIITETPTKEELETWIKKYNIKIEKLYNTFLSKFLILLWLVFLKHQPKKN